MQAFKTKKLLLAISIIVILACCYLWINRDKSTSQNIWVLLWTRRVATPGTIFLWNLNEDKGQFFDTSNLFKDANMALLDIGYNGITLSFLVQNPNQEVILYNYNTADNWSKILITKGEVKRKHLYILQNNNVYVMINERGYGVSLSSNNVIFEEPYNFKTDYHEYGKNGDIKSYDTMIEGLNSQNRESSHMVFRDLQYDVSIITNRKGVWLYNAKNISKLGSQSSFSTKSYRYPYIIGDNRSLYSEEPSNWVAYILGIEKIPRQHVFLLDVQNKHTKILPESEAKYSFDYESASIIVGEEEYKRLLKMFKEVNIK